MAAGKSRKRRDSRIGNHWIGVDLDGTLALWDGWKGHEHIGEPIPAMLERVKRWIKMDIEVRIFTARASVPEHVIPVKKWLAKNGLGDLTVTNEKDYRMLQLWDDRCVQVVPNTGELIKNAHWVEPAPVTTDNHSADNAEPSEPAMKTVLAQLNIARLRYPLDSPELAGFVDNLDRINALAESSEGFVWRFLGDQQAEWLVFGDQTIVNISTWRDIKSLHRFVYRSDHTEIMRKRESWFVSQDVYAVLWWHTSTLPPTLEQAKSKLDLLVAKGPTAEAFTFRHQWPDPAIS